MAKKKDKWIEVVFASDCIYQVWDDYFFCCHQYGLLLLSLMGYQQNTQQPFYVPIL